MPDQAAGLRSLFARRRPALLVVAGCDASKAAVAVHFAREAAAGGRATVLVDATAGELAAACDLACRYELAHVIAGDKALADVAQAVTPHLLLLPAARALARFGSFDRDETARLDQAFSVGIVEALARAGASDTQVDLIVVHAEHLQAERAVEAFGRDARVVLVASNEAASLRGAYLELKALSRVADLENFEVVVPRFDEAEPASVAYANLASAARRFLDIDLRDGGAVPLSARRDTVVGIRSTRPRHAPRATGRPSSSHSSFIEEVPHAAAVG